jgi:predicted ATPase
LTWVRSPRAPLTFKLKRHFGAAPERESIYGWRLWYSEFRGTLALALAGTGQLDEALLQQAAGQLVLAAEDCFNQAAQLAGEQGALFWELRVALSVARLRVSQGRAHEARARLAPVYDRFTEGFATADMQTAHTLLEALPP